MKLSEAKKLEVGQILYHVSSKNTDGTAQRWRVNGMVKRWKRDVDRIRIPIKHGLYDHDYIDNDTLNLLTIKEII